MPNYPFSPYSTVKPFLSDSLGWYPKDERDRVGAYCKYDEIYWNDESQFSLRVLLGEQPLYIPNARTIVDTTSYYLLKGLQIVPEDPEKSSALNTSLNTLLKREMFYSRFHTAKHAGVARGDFVFHITADPKKKSGSRLSMTSVDPCNVIPVYDDDDITKLLKVHLIDIYYDTEDLNKRTLKKLTYEYVIVDGQQRVARTEGLYKLNDNWYGLKPDLIKTTLPEALLPAQIDTIPIYWFKNIDWEGQQYGSSEIRGFERLLQGISQAATDQEAALALEGLGVYATDGGRPVGLNGVEEDWEVAPGKVMEVPSGAYFRRVEGLGSVKPSMDHIDYIESKLREAGGLSDVALGRVDVQTASSGIALAIKFIPTLAKVEERDQAGKEKLQQMFFDWQNAWMPAYEGETPTGEIAIKIGQKLPEDRVARVNELNNMFDRDVISTQYYRAQMVELGYVFPDDIQDQIDAEKEKGLLAQAAAAAAAAPPGLAGNAADAVTGEKAPPPGPNGSQDNKKPNNSNNQSKPNESSGTESGHTLRRQSRGGKP